MRYEIKRELEKWQDKAIFDVKFKPNSYNDAHIIRLKKILHEESLEHFVMIAANSEALVYKISRFFIEEGVKSDDINLIQGQIIKSYIGDDSADWAKKTRADDFFQIFAGDFKNKWVAIPYMDFEISVGLAIYFMTQFRKSGAIGVIFYAEGPSNIVEVMSTESGDPYLYEYPKKKYLKKRRQLEDDEW